MNAKNFDGMLKNEIKKDYLTYREKIVSCIEENTHKYIEQYLKNKSYNFLLKFTNEEDALDIVESIDFSKFIDLEKEKKNYIDSILDEYNDGLISSKGLKKTLDRILY